MVFPEYGEYDGVGLAGLVRAGEVSAREVLEEAIRRAEAVNPALNFLCHKAYDDARRAADDPALPDGPFKGVPWLVKELATAWAGPRPRRSTASLPATRGAAKEVPRMPENPPPGRAAAMSEPGAAKSTCVPRQASGSTRSRRSTPVTEITSGQAAG